MSRSFYWLPVEPDPEGKYVEYTVGRTVYDYMCNRAGVGDWNNAEVPLIHQDERLQGYLDGLAEQWAWRAEHGSGDERQRAQENLDALSELRAQMETYGAVTLFYRN